MNISLTPELKAFVQSRVSSGFYNNASEVIREALRLLNERDQIKALKLELLKKELSLGLESLDQEDFGDPDIDSIAENILKDHQNRKDL